MFSLIESKIEKEILTNYYLLFRDNGGKSQLHNAPPSPFLQRSMHTSSQLGADVVVVVVLLLIVVTDGVGLVVGVVGTGMATVDGFDDLVVESVWLVPESVDFDGLESGV